MTERPTGEALWGSLASVAKSSGPAAARPSDKLQAIMAGLDLAAIPPALTIAVSETLAYLYQLDQAAEVAPRRKR
ncbi:MAG: hypothetical protein HY692_06790 [Cyanobacteria bacterium NC_groundwater_1444_Ag_S-0.65um_54_12]|nr:hypothetical protein [Cyanobacteria bacterium NC_groundwater_1444_Ag_S-0.65um_54_12]